VCVWVGGGGRGWGGGDYFANMRPMTNLSQYLEVCATMTKFSESGVLTEEGDEGESGHLR
jgi:hypothetical protein